MSKHKRTPDRLRYTPIIVAVFVALCAALVITGRAQAQPVPWHQPYGGCPEASLAPHSVGAQECRAHGWTIRTRLVVNPRHVVKGSGLPHCRYEDGSGQRSACSWNFHDGRADGNGRGFAYWVDRHNRAHYVWAHRPVRLDRGWHWAGARADERAHHIPRWCIARDDTTIASGLVADCRVG
jgi:hypothetical protein